MSQRLHVTGAVDGAPVAGRSTRRGLPGIVLALLMAPIVAHAQSRPTLNLDCVTTANWPGYAGTQYLVALDLAARTSVETQVYPNGSHVTLPPGSLTFVSDGAIAGFLDYGNGDSFSLNRYTGTLTLQVVPGVPPHPHTFLCHQGATRF